MSLSVFCDFEAVMDREADSWYQEGEWAYYAKDWKKAFDMYSKAAERDHEHALYSLGVLYASGKGVQQSFESAFKCYYLAAEKGHCLSKRKVAECYKDGCGVEENLRKALEWYGNAAQAGDSEAAFKLGYFYENGFGVLPSAVEAVNWYLIAKNRESYLKLGYCYQYGFGVPRNEEKAREYFQKSDCDEARTALQRLSNNTLKDLSDYCRTTIG